MRELEDALPARPELDAGQPAWPRVPPDVYHGRKKTRSQVILRHPRLCRPSRFGVQPERRKRSVHFENVSVFLDAASNGEIEEVQRMLENGEVDVNACTGLGETALHKSAARDQSELLEYLLGSGAHVNAVSEEGWSPLHSAAAAGALEAVRVLLKHSADIELRTQAGDLASDLTEIAEIQRLLRQALARKYVSGTVVALYAFDASILADSQANELSFERGSRLEVLDRLDPDWWLARKADGTQGYVPRTLVQ